MKGDKAAGAAKSGPEWRSCRETNEGRQGGRSSQEQARMETNEGRQMKGDKAAGAAKSRPEWRQMKAAAAAKSSPE